MSKAWAIAVASLAAAVAAGGGCAADPGSAAPQRVVSMNLCTDQLALLVAAPGQLVSISYLAHRPAVSVLAARASGLTANHGAAEEVFLLRPDLVIVGAYTTRETVAMLQRLGVRIEAFAPASDFPAIRRNIARMGAILGQPGRAEAVTAELDEQLDAVRRQPASASAPRAATYTTNSYSAGAGTLPYSVIGEAGLHPLADDLGFSGTRDLPLEVLVLEQPELVITPEAPAGPRSRAEDVLVHPALLAPEATGKVMQMPNRLWICGAPFTATAVARLATATRPPEGERQ